MTKENEMPWFNADDTLHSSMEAMRAGIDAMGLWVLAGTWCAGQLSDGFIPEAMVKRLDPDEYKGRAAALVRAGFWEECEENGEEGWRFIGRFHSMRTREEVEKKRKRSREDQRVKRAKAKSDEASASGDDDVAGNFPETFDQLSDTYTYTYTHTSTEPKGSVEQTDETKPKRRTRKPKPSMSADDPRFVEFWAVYPKRVAKKSAVAAFAVAVIANGVDHNEIVDGARRYAAERDGQDPKYTAQASSWLNNERWTDEVHRPGSSVTPFTGGAAGPSTPSKTTEKVNGWLAMAGIGDR